MWKCWFSSFGAALVALCVALPAFAQERLDADAGKLTGTLKKIRDAGVVTIGYRENSFPFSYLGPGKVPVGYSLELCQAIVDEIGGELDGKPVEVRYRPVTPETRMQAVASGEVDLECGSTTNNTARQKQVAFSPIIFVSGTKLLVRRADRIRSYRDLRDKTVVVTAGTTNEQALRAFNEKQKLGLKLVTAPDHDASPSQPTTCCCTAGSRARSRAASTPSWASTCRTTRTGSCSVATIPSSRRWSIALSGNSPRAASCAGSTADGSSGAS